MSRDIAGTDVTSLGALSRRPAVSLVLVFALGIALHDLLPHNAAAMMAITGLVVALAAIEIDAPYRCSALLAIAIALCAAGFAQREHFQYPANHVGQFAGDEPRLAEVELRLIDEPRIITGSFGQLRPLPPKQIVSADVLRVKTWNGWVAASGRTVLQVDQPHPRLDAGQIVHVYGMLQRPPPPMNPGQFDWSDYYRRQRLLATISARRAENVQIIAEPGPSAVQWLQIKSRRLLAIGFTAKHAIDAAMLRALVLGDRDPQMREVQEQFMQTGVAYQMNVSGLHVVLLAIFALWLCACARLRPRYSLAIATVFIALYVTVSLPAFSGVRSLILWFALAIALFVRRPTNRFQLLALAVLAMLVWNPMDLYSGGFQLSVVAVAGLTLFLPRVRELLLRWRDPHLVAAGSLYRQSIWEAALARPLAMAIKTLEFTFIGWLATLPLIAWQFGQLNPWAMFAGALLLPLVFAALLGGILKILFTLLWPASSSLFALVAGWPIAGVQYAVYLLAKLPGANVPMAAPPVWVIVAYYALLLAPLIPRVPLLTGRRRWCVRCVPFAGVAAMFLLPVFPTLQHPVATVVTPTLRVTLLSVGAGQCAVIEPPGGQPILFDAGSSSISDVARKVIAPFLRSDGRRQIDRIFLSHGDYDHMCAAAELVTAYGVHEVFMSPHFRRNAEGNQPDEVLLDMLDRLDMPPHIIAAGDRVDLGGGAMVDVLWPLTDCNENSNNAGLVLRLSYGGRTILFPADIQDPAFAGVIKHADALPADVLVAPHHGSFERLTPAFVHAVHPSYIVSSNAWRLTNKQKRFDDSVRDYPEYRTNQCGAITITIDQQGKLTLETFLVNGQPKR